MGTNLISTLSWKYSLATGGGNSGSLLGIRKTLNVNNEDLLTVFYDKLQRRQVIYALTSSGKEELLEVRYDSLSRPLIYEASTVAFASLNQSYDIFGNLQSWAFGELGESYTYDKGSRLVEVSRGNVSYLKYGYKDNFDVLPRSVKLGDNSQFR